MKFTCAILTVNDSCFEKTTTDENGPALAEAIKANFPEALGPVSCTVVSDAQDEIIASIECLCKHEINLILTMGGTGLEPTQMITISRAVIGIKDNSLVINLPGNLNEALESFELIKSIVPNLIDSILSRKESAKQEAMKKHDDEDTDSVTITNASKIEEENSKISYFKFVPTPMRSKSSSYEVVSFKAAMDIVCDEERYAIIKVEEILIEDSINRVLAEDVMPNWSFSNPFRISTQDGYAVKCSDGEGERILNTSCTTHHIDESEFVVQPGEAVRVSLGGCVPKGADAVVPLKDTDLIQRTRNEIKIMINTAPKYEENINATSINWTDGSKPILEHRYIITAGHIGVLSALGYKTVSVYKRASVGIFSTGEGLYSQNTIDFNADRILNTNNLVLLNLLKCFGYTAKDLGIVKLHSDLLKQALHKAFTDHDFIITTGGVSTADYELIKEILEVDFGATMQFGRVTMEPGHFTSYATCSFNGSLKHIFSLPGDIASVMVACRVFVIPALRTFEGSNDDSYTIHTFQVETDGCQIENNGSMKFRRVILSKGISSVINAISFEDDVRNTCDSTDAALIMIPEKKTINSHQSVTLDAIMLYS